MKKITKIIKIIKMFCAICFIVIPVSFEFYLLFIGIQTEIENGYQNNGYRYIAFQYIIPSGSLILCSCAYFFVKLKYFPFFNMLLGFISLGIGEIVFWFRYKLSFMTLWNVILIIAIISFWIFIKSFIFKKIIYQWLQ